MWFCRQITFLHCFFNDPATTEIYTLSLHDALPICHCVRPHGGFGFYSFVCGHPRLAEPADQPATVVLAGRGVACFGPPVKLTANPGRHDERCALHAAGKFISGARLVGDNARRAFLAVYIGETFPLAVQLAQPEALSAGAGSFDRPDGDVLCGGKLAWQTRMGKLSARVGSERRKV